MHETFRTPYRITILVGILVAALAGFVSLDTLADFTNIGTLFAFMLVSIAVLILRRRRPDLPRTFRVPGMPVTPVLAVLAALYLMQPRRGDVDPLRRVDGRRLRGSTSLYGIRRSKLAPGTWRAGAVERSAASGTVSTRRGEHAVEQLEAASLEHAATAAGALLVAREQRPPSPATPLPPIPQKRQHAPTRYRRRSPAQSSAASSCADLDSARSVDCGPRRQHEGNSDGDLECVCDELGPEVIGHRPADDPAAEAVRSARSAWKLR